ncbi:lipoyl(octanoyl) transferase LipB [candidate division KSB1 bacterium]|nr:lipoyl(octanoyl) transferase LipB [candidate division KSB1 bacterium]
MTKKNLPEYAIIELGQMDVPAVDDVMAALVTQRQADRIADLLLFLSYNPCLAFGARQLNDEDLKKPQDYFAERGIPIFKTGRGGGLTYHWPGQLICYPLLKLRPDEHNIPGYMHNLEQIGIETLMAVGVRAQRKRHTAAHIGLWIGSNKIASMGIRIARSVTSYGFALNLLGDVSPAHDIRPCGLDVKLTTVEEQTGVRPDTHWMKEKVQHSFEKIFRRRLGNFASQLPAVVRELQNNISTR